VVEHDRRRGVGDQLEHGSAALLLVQAGDDHDGQQGALLLGQRSPPFLDRWRRHARSVQVGGHADGGRPSGNARGTGGVTRHSTRHENENRYRFSWERTRTVARNELRPIIKLRSTAGTGYTYVTRKNRRNDPDRLTLRKYDPAARSHVEFREER
jgi:large subunit ribosomal protein L33